MFKDDKKVCLVNLTYFLLVLALYIIRKKTIMTYYVYKI